MYEWVINVTTEYLRLILVRFFFFTVDDRKSIFHFTIIGQSVSIVKITIVFENDSS